MYFTLQPTIIVQLCLLVVTNILVIEDLEGTRLKLI